MKTFSNNGDDWKDFEEAIQQPCEDLEAGDTFELAGGDEVRVPIKKFLCAYSLLEQVAENASDNYGEFAEDFATDIDGDKSAVAELQCALEFLVQGWAEKHNRLPDFYDVENVTWSKWKVVNPHNYEVEPVQ